ncbi:MAG: LolA-like outer membrane lipoprotein chaperone [Sulfurimonas sp.]|nr:LolA-like outer membrane lipoprotein chaperone [Sulfurimonas sp.]MDQ7068816.1 LolA-like outer membrane lipoprotein chaperone [Sulfurimonas sp.]
MRYIFLLTLLFTLSFSDVFSMNSFEADFTQTVTNEKGNRLEYKGRVKALKPQYALWKYLQPSIKLIYVNNNQATIIEPELEQVIVKHLKSKLDFFNIIKHAKKIDTNTYVTNFQSVKYTMHLRNSQLKSIEYKDQLDNIILINFTNHSINREIDISEFNPLIPAEYDIIDG